MAVRICGDTSTILRRAPSPEAIVINCGGPWPCSVIFTWWCLEVHCEQRQRQFFSFCEKSRVSSFQVAAKSIFDIAAPALVGRVHTLHYIWQGRFVCSQIKAGCLYHFGGQAEVRCFVKEIPSKSEYGGRWGEEFEVRSFVVKFLTTHFEL